MTHRIKALERFILVAGLAMADTAAAQITVTKSAKIENPTLYISDFAGAPEASGLLRNGIGYCGWFDIVTTPDADYHLSGAYRQTGSDRVVEITVSDAGGRPVSRFSQQSTATERKLLIYSAVDELIRRLFNNPGFCTSRLAYVKELEGRKEIWLADFDGDNPEQLTHNNSLSVEPDWGVDNRHLVYTAYQRHAMDIVLVDMHMHRQRRLTQFPGLNSGAAFANSGHHAAVTLTHKQQVDLFIIDLETGKLQQLTDNRGLEASPCWSPDDRKICFVSNEHSRRPTLFLVPSRGGRSKRLLRQTLECVSPDWSAVSNRICCAVRRGGRYTIGLVEMRGKGRKLDILVDAPGDWESPSWAADGRHVVCTRNFDGRKSLYLVDTLNGRIVQLKNFTGDDSLPSYSGRF